MPFNHFFIMVACEEVAQSCVQHELALQLLGSGGPIADDKRALSGYLIRQGGGVFLRTVNHRHGSMTWIN